MTESNNLLEMHHAYRLARSLGYKQDRPIDYCTISRIIAAAYSQGLNDAKEKGLGKGGTC